MSFLPGQLALLPPSVAREVAQAPPRADEVTTSARDGTLINGLDGGGRPVYFHSRYDPAREAERVASVVTPSSFVVVVGMGMAHHVRAIAARNAAQLVVEPDASLVRSALANVDLRDLLATGSLRIVTGGAIDRLADEIGATYLPAFHRGLSVVSLAGRVRAEPDRMDRLLASIREATERLKDDLAVQARFGRGWMRNTLLNLPHASTRGLPDWTGEPVTVCAAGPSLDEFCDAYAPRTRTRIVAVDSALPVLLARGIRPDLAVTIDCQVATYHHFLNAAPADLPVVAELAIYPSVFRRLSEPIAVLGDHPLHRLLALLGLRLPSVDVRGGNVTQTAVDVAVRTGAAGITLVGADYSYPHGRTYARGSYVHRHFRHIATRTRPVSSLHYSFLVGRPGVRRDPARPGAWTQPSLDRYAASLAAYAASCPVRIRRVQGCGAPLRLPLPTGGGEDPAAPPAAATRSPREILVDLTERFGRLVDPSALRAALASSPPDALAARALLPLLTSMRAAAPDAADDELLAEAIRWSSELIAVALRQ